MRIVWAGEHDPAEGQAIPDGDHWLKPDGALLERTDGEWVPLVVDLVHAALGHIE